MALMDWPPAGGECPFLVRVAEDQLEDEVIEQAVAHRVRDVRSVTPLDLDDPEGRENFHGFADRAPARRELLGELHFVRKPVASFQLPREEQIANGFDDRLDGRFSLLGLEYLSVDGLSHCLVPFFLPHCKRSE